MAKVSIQTRVEILHLATLKPLYPNARTKSELIASIVKDMSEILVKQGRVREVSSTAEAGEILSSLNVVTSRGHKALALALAEEADAEGTAEIHDSVQQALQAMTNSKEQVE